MDARFWSCWSLGLLTLSLSASKGFKRISGVKAARTDEVFVDTQMHSYLPNRIILDTLNRLKKPVTSARALEYERTTN